MQTVLETLLTPNAFVTKLVTFPLSIFEMIFTLFIALLIINQKVTKQQKFHFVLLYYLTYSICYLFFNDTIKIVFAVSILFALLVFVLKANKIKALIIIVMSHVTTALAQIIAITLLKIIFEVEPSQFIEIPIFRIAFQLCTYAIISIFYLVFRNLKSYLNIIDNFPKKTKMLIAFNCTFGVIVIILYSIILGYNIENKFTDIFMLFSMIIFFIISLYTTFKSNELETAKQNLENSKLYNKTLSLLLDNLKTFKHDYNNVLQSIGGYLRPEENIEGLKEYYSSIVKEAHQVNNLYVLNPETINNPAVLRNTY